MCTHACAYKQSNSESMASFSIGVNAKQGSILHLLLQRQMEMNDHKIEKLGGRIFRSVIVQVV